MSASMPPAEATVFLFDAFTHLSIEKKFFIDNLLVRIHFIIVVIRRTGLAPWEFEFPFTGSLTSGHRLLVRRVHAPTQGYLAHKKQPP